MDGEHLGDGGAGPPVLTIVGAGPGIGAAAARCFGRAGYRVGLVARDRGRLDRLVDELGSERVTAAAATADVLRPDELRPALDDLAARLGPTDVLLVSALPDVALIKPVLATSAEDLLTSLSLTVGGAAVAAQAVLPAMRRRGRGALLFTTGSGALLPSAARAASGVTTTAATVYFRLLHDALAPEGVHVGHVVVVGAVGPDGPHRPAEVARHLLAQVDGPEPVTVLR